jgi:cytochrome c-type biogenesis protein
MDLAVLSTGTVTADPLGLLVSFGAGILSFLSPCVLPLVPGYLSMVSGLSAAELEAVGRISGAASGDPVVSGADSSGEVSDGPGVATRGGLAVAVAVAEPVTEPVTCVPARVVPGTGVGDGRPVGALFHPPASLVRGIAGFIAGFTVVFVALGAAASGLGHLLGTHRSTLTTLSGAVVVALGIVLLVSALPAGTWTRLGATAAGRVGWLTGERRFHVRPSSLGMWAAPVMGMAFAFAWTPCIGPVLAGVLGLAATRSTLGGGVVLLLAYSLGLGVPFLVTGLAFGRLTGVLARARRGLWVVHLVTGGILVAFGILLLGGQLGWLSAQFSDLLNHLGLHRLTSS